MKKLLLVLLLCPLMGLAQKNLVHKDYVDDFAGIYSNEQKAELATIIHGFFDTVQIALVTVPSLEGRDVSDFATTLFNQWGVGSAGNNGLLILIAPNERKAFAATGRGIQGSLTDLISAKLQRELMVPEFKKGNKFQGTKNLLIGYIGILRGDGDIKNVPGEKDYTTAVLVVFALITGFALIMAIVFRRRRKKEEMVSSIASASSGYRSYGGGYSGGGGNTYIVGNSIGSDSSYSSGSSSSYDGGSSYSSGSSSSDSSSSFDSGSSFGGGSSDGGGGGSDW